MIDPYPSTFERRDVLPAAGVAFAIITGSEAIGGAVLFALAVRVLLWMVLDHYGEFPGSRKRPPGQPARE